MLLGHLEVANGLKAKKSVAAATRKSKTIEEQKGKGKGKEVVEIKERTEIEGWLLWRIGD
jgi:hypothetical protein